MGVYECRGVRNPKYARRTILSAVHRLGYKLLVLFGSVRVRQCVCLAAIPHAHNVPSMAQTGTQIRLCETNRFNECKLAIATNVAAHCPVKAGQFI